MNHFDELIWSRLVEAIRANENLVITLSQQKKNIVKRITEDGFLVATKADPQLVLKPWVIDAWNAFVEKGSLTAGDIPGQGRHRSSFIMALFALLPEVTVIPSLPISLKLSQLPETFIDQTTWIFQGNPNRFDIEGYINDRRYIWWSLKQRHFENEIRSGDEVFLWRTESGQQGSGGIIARGIIIGPPTMRTDEDAKHFWRTDDWKTPGVGVPIELQEVKITDGRVLRTTILQNDVLRDLLIIQMANQTNYKVSTKHAAELRKIWGQSDITFNDDDDEGMLFPEGKRVFRKHRIIERNPHLIKAAKEKYKKSYGELCCMACGFSFVKQYGPIGEDFIEGHHTTPISEINGQYHAKIEDIALVCSNCHRMLHRKRPWLTMEYLTQLLNK